MKIQFAVFLVPLIPESPEQDALNSFIRGHRIIEVHKQLITGQAGMVWSFLLEYFDETRKEQSGKQGVDYKEILSAEDFTVFSRLRELRKKLAEAEAVPIYAVFTNEQLAAIAKAKPENDSQLQNIPGIGQARVAKFGHAVLLSIREKTVEADRVSF
jgi:superfamily II DNA helicase RecQ